MIHRDRPRVLLVNAKTALATAIAARPDVDAIVLADAKHRRDFETNGCGAAIADVPYQPGAKMSPRAIRSVRTAIARLEPDAVHAFYPRALAHTVLATAGMRRRPKIVSYRGVTAPAAWWSPVQWITYLSAKVNVHACESDAVRQSLVSAGVPAARCVVAYNCLTSPVERCDRDEARQAWDVPREAFVVAMTANMRPVKGADVLVRAALECADLAEVYFVLMGRVHDERVKRLARDPRGARIRLTGFLPDAARLISAADVFVMPSRAEALCVALLEAMAQGVCPVVSDAGGMKEAVRRGQDGLVFPSGDWGALAEAIRTLRGDDALRRRLAASAQRRAATEFSAAAVAERLVRVYRDVAGYAPYAKPQAAA